MNVHLTAHPTLSTCSTGNSINTTWPSLMQNPEESSNDQGNADMFLPLPVPGRSGYGIFTSISGFLLDASFPSTHSGSHIIRPRIVICLGETAGMTEDFPSRA